MCAQRESNVFGSLLIDSSPCKICGTVFEVASNLRCAFSGLNTKADNLHLSAYAWGKIGFEFFLPLQNWLLL